MSFAAWQWLLLAAGAFTAGFSKTGIPGLGIMFVAIFSNLMPARQATGVVLPLLLVGDVFAVVSYRAHAQWKHLWRLLAPTVVGVVFGWAALRWANDAQTTRLVGTLLAIMLVVHLLRKARPESAEAASHAPLWLGVLAGVFAGFATQVANAAGPVMMLYLLAMRLPKLEFLGTSAVFFLAVNLFKVPFMAQLGLINRQSLALNLWLVPAVIAGALIGRVVAGKVNQRAFEAAALGLTALATAKLLFF
ncbi:MAG: sulfite exporter TauE/SafE family protein [Candidatus Didemnitutus sp.]|nr:sulfite exporter TauE/SafE family protein [Candidatus Didemnitutus sp.]